MWKKADKNCVDCGVLLENVNVSKLRCAECAKKRIAVYRERSKLKMLEKQGLGKQLKPEHKNPCEGCKYWFGNNEFSICCNYIFIKGHRRPCPPGNECTVKETRK